MNRREKFISHMRVNAAKTTDMVAKRYINQHVANASRMSDEEFAEYEAILAEIAVAHARNIEVLVRKIREYVDFVYETGLTKTT